jgi:hypothetical protein
MTPQGRNRHISLTRVCVKICNRIFSVRRTSMKKRRQPKTSRDDHREVVRTLAAAGLSGDVIAATLKLGKNRLRAEHALDLHSGREAKKADAAAKAAAELPREEREQLERIKASFKSHWYTKEFGNDLYNGAHTIAEALEWCRRFKSARDPNDEGTAGDD